MTTREVARKGTDIHSSKAGTLNNTSDRAISTEEALELPNRLKHEHFLLGIFENCNKSEGDG